MDNLTDIEKNKISELKAQGYNISEITSYIAGQRTNRAASGTIGNAELQATNQMNHEENRSILARVLGDIPSDLLEGVTGIGEQFKKTGEKMKSLQERTQTGLSDDQTRTLSPFVAGFGHVGAVGSLAAGVVGEAALTGAKVFTTDEFEKKVAEKLGVQVEAIANSPEAQSAVKWYDSLDDNAKETISGTLGIIDGVTSIYGLGAVKSIPAHSQTLLRDARGALKVTDVPKAGGAKEAVTATEEMPPHFGEKITAPKKIDDPQIETIASYVDDVVKDVPKAAPDGDVSFRERLIGLTPDVKQVLTEDPELLGEYIDVALARNKDVRSATPFGYAQSRTLDAVASMEQKAQDIGKKIGDFRDEKGKLISVDTAPVLESLYKNLEKLNLQVTKDGVTQIPGTIAKVDAKDISFFNELIKESTTFIDNPNLINAFGLRSYVDKTINFKKRVGDVSSAVDPFSRQFRSDIADAAARAAGRSHKADIDEYSEIMSALDEVRSFTDRKTGGLFLLRLATSGRGSEAVDVINTIKKHTGTDLIRDAHMMTIVTDLLGNQGQKTLFAQQIAKANIDTVRLLHGDPTGFIGSISKKVAEGVTDPEQILRGLAGQTDNSLAGRMGRAVDITAEAAKQSYETAKKSGLGLAIEDISKNPEYMFTGLPGLSTKLIESMKGAPKIINQARFENMINAAKKAGIKPADEQILRDSIVIEDGNINLTKTAEAVQAKLLPLTTKEMDKFEGTALPYDVRGDVANYTEHIYESPIETSAGQQHYGGQTENYFAHSRIEDMADNDTRRVIEIQSDLFQAGKLEREIGDMEAEIEDLTRSSGLHQVIDRTAEGKMPSFKEYVTAENLKPGDILTPNLRGSGGQRVYRVLEVLDDSNVKVEQLYRPVGVEEFDIDKYLPNFDAGSEHATEILNTKKGGNATQRAAREARIREEYATRQGEVERLQPYKNTWYERIIREEVAKAAQDGKTKLQFPSGETAAYVEGHAKPGGGADIGIYTGAGDTIRFHNDDWVVVEMTGDESARAVPISKADRSFDWRDVHEDIRRDIIDTHISDSEISSDDVTSAFKDLDTNLGYVNAYPDSDITYAASQAAEKFMKPMKLEVRNAEDGGYIVYDTANNVTIYSNRTRDMAEKSLKERLNRGDTYAPTFLDYEDIAKFLEEHPEIDKKTFIEDVVYASSEEIISSREKAIEWLKEFDYQQVGSEDVVFAHPNNDFEIGIVEPGTASRFAEDVGAGGDPTASPVYNFYEKSITNYLKKRYKAKQVTDENDMTWTEVDITPDMKGLPVEAFGAVPPLVGGAAQLGGEEQQK